MLANADKLQRLCAEAYTALYEGDEAALPALGIVWRKVGDLAALDARFTPYLEAREAVKSQLEDLAFFLRSYAADIDASPARLQEIEDRLAALERLKKKHGPSLDDVARRRPSACAAICTISSTPPNGRVELDQALDARTGRLPRGGRGGCPTARREAAPDFSKRLERALADLAMTRTRCEVRLTDPANEAQLVGAWARDRRVLHLAEPRRGPAAAGADRVGRRAVADHAGAEDAGHAPTRPARR